MEALGFSRLLHFPSVSFIILKSEVCTSCFQNVSPSLPPIYNFYR